MDASATRPSLPGLPIAFAHRGASAHAAENTLEAFSLAVKLGATGVESDAWLSADGIPVLVHDRTIRRPGHRIDVTRRTAAELATYGVPSLADLYAAIGTDREVSLDVQHPPAAGPVVDAALAAGAPSRLWACSPSLEVLRTIRDRSGEVRVVCSTRPRRVPAGLRSLVSELVDLDADALNLHWRDWTPELVDLAHGARLLAFGWDAQADEAIARLLGLGIDAIYSDWPERIVAALSGRRGQPASIDPVPSAAPAGGL